MASDSKGVNTSVLTAQEAAQRRAWPLAAVRDHLKKRIRGRVELSPQALLDLEEITDFIARDDFDTALRWVDRLIERPRARRGDH